MYQILRVSALYDWIVWLSYFIDRPCLSVANVEARSLLERPGQIIEPPSVASILVAEGGGDVDNVALGDRVTVSVHPLEGLNTNWDIPELACINIIIIK